MICSNCGRQVVEGELHRMNKTGGCDMFLSGKLIGSEPSPNRERFCQCGDSLDNHYHQEFAGSLVAIPCSQCGCRDFNPHRG